MAIGTFKPTLPSVLETRSDPVIVGADEIAGLIAAARRAPKGRARLMLHPDRSDPLHEMVIALPPTSCDHPHINYKSGKSFLAMSGQFAVMRFSDDGQDIETIVLSAGGWPGARLVRLRAPAWHTIVPLAGDIVFLETIIGPFEGNRFAPWFPPEAEIDARRAFADRLRARARGVASLL